MSRLEKGGLSNEENSGCLGCIGFATLPSYNHGRGKWVHPILVSFHLASFSTSIILGGQVICKGITHLVRFHIDTCVTRGCKLESTKWSLDEFSS